MNFLPFTTFSLSSFSLFSSLFFPSLCFLYFSINTLTFSLLRVSFLFFPSRTITHILFLVIPLSISSLYASPLSILFLSLSSSSFSHPSIKSTRSSSLSSIKTRKDFRSEKDNEKSKRKVLRKRFMIEIFSANLFFFFQSVTCHFSCIKKNIIKLLRRNNEERNFFKNLLITKGEINVGKKKEINSSLRS